MSCAEKDIVSVPVGARVPGAGRRGGGRLSREVARDERGWLATSGSDYARVAERARARDSWH
eukprot:5325982-Pleurochrysis_carterae.AAC.3